MLPLRTDKTIAKIVLKLLSVSVRFLLLLTFVSCITFNLKAEDYPNISDYSTKNDSLNDSITVDSLNPSDYNSLLSADSLNPTYYNSLLSADSTTIDSTQTDTIIKPRSANKEGLKDKVKYSADDSMKISVTGERLYLYGNADVQYLNIDLKANYIMLDMTKEDVFAKGTIDTSGKVIGSPVFKQGSETFNSDSMRYNFKSKKGIIYNIYTKEGDGYLESEVTKRMDDGQIDVRHGKYTTCDAKEPHFYIAMTKAIVIPEDKIVSGPAYLVVAGVPIEFPFIPFGFFPNTSNSKSGILVPSYGYGGDQRGFFLENIGWYQVLGQHADLTLRSNIYSLGSWEINVSPRYVFKYRCTGNFSFHYAVNKNNDNIAYPSSTEYKVVWQHTQDPKATPNQNFNASVNFGSAKYDQRNSLNPTEYLSGTQQSTISFSRRWPVFPLNIQLSAAAVKNIQTQNDDIDLPSGSIGLTKAIYPFRKNSLTGKYKWWENISVNYSSSFDNHVNTYDSILFKNETLNRMQTDFTQNVPITVNFKIGKMISISPSVTYTGTAHAKRINIDTVIYSSSTKDSLITVIDTVHGIKYLQGINPSISISFSPKIYGMLISKRENSYVMAIRHVMSPFASFSFTPDMHGLMGNYYDSIFYIDRKNTKKLYKVYSSYQNEKYGVPVASGKSGTLSLSLNNNLEMKVRPKNDTTGQPKKVSILDRLNFATAYHPFVSEFKWDDLTMNTGTSLFNKTISLQANGVFSPYALSKQNGAKIDTFYYKTDNKLLRFSNVSLSGNFTLKSKQAKKKDQSQQSQNQQNTLLPNETQSSNFDTGIDEVPTNMPGHYVEFNIPWSLSAGYSWSYAKTIAKPSITNTLNLNGNFSLTKKWQVSFSGGYDLKAKKLTSTNFNISRDLHCWQMTFSVTPFGKYAFYTFTIQAKSSLLRDLKYNKQSDYRYDNF